MKQKLFSCLIILICTQSYAVRLMTFNYQKSVPIYLIPTWDQYKKNKEFGTKRSLAVKLLKDFAPDIIGFQEPHLGDLEYFENSLSNYDWTGLPVLPLSKQDKLQLFLSFGKAGSDYNPIFYNKTKCTLLQSGTFGLNDDLERGENSSSWNVPGRRHFHVRACSWAKFKDNVSSKTFWVFNTHLSLDIPVARLEIALIEQQIQKIAGNEPIFFIGDFNVTFQPTPNFINSRDYARMIINGSLGSYKNFTLDYILMKNVPTNKVSLHGVINYSQGYTKDGIVPSDHRPVYADIVL